MKKPLLIAALFLAPVLTHAQQRLVWEENFDTPTLNLNTWTYEIGDGCAKNNCGWGNAELEYYTNSSNNVRIENGHLVIQARREDMGGKPFTSGRIKTAGRVGFKYGTLEARIKVPRVGNGLWPAFWLLGSTGGEWPHNGEVDILEMGFAGAIAAGKANNTVSAATHWWTENPGGYTGHATYAKDTVVATPLSDDYHIYRLTWDKSFLTIWLDNNPYYKIGIDGGNGLDAFQNPFYILLNLAVGGNYPGIHSAGEVTAPLPGAMEVDYIRLYQDITQGDQLILGTDNAPEGNYGIFTDNTPVNDRVAGNLYYWNNITDIKNAVPFEGSHVWGFHANAGNWFGLGIANDDKNMSNFASGSLKFNLKTTSATSFKVGISTGSGEGWVMFTGSNEHGLVRDGQWHEVTIPVSEFGAVDLLTVNQLFMFSGDAPAAAADFYIDNVYYTGGVSANPAPVVSISNPAADALFNIPATIPVRVSATDSNGSIAKVDYYNGDKYLGTVTTAPFTFNWTTSTQGVATLIAKATDNQGKTTTSKPVTVFIAAANNTPPQVSITAPATLIKPAKVNIQANVTDDGGIYKVEFYNGSTLLGTVTKAPYTFTWADVDMGTYTVTAKAYDNGKLSTVSQPVTVIVQDNKVLTDLYGIYSNDAAITNKVTYGQDANLYVWNNLTTIANAAPYEGAEVLAFTAAAGNWFGLGVANDVRDLTYFSNGYLKFHFKTTYQGSFRFSVIAASGQTDISFAAGEQKLGLIRDGQWHEVTIPVNMLTGTDLTKVTQLFTFSGDAPAASASFYIDNIYYTTGNNTTGVNLALNKSAIASTNENVGTLAPNAVDGDANTRWSSAFEDPQWISVDLGADYNINRVKITWEAAMGKDYQVQVSTDQSTWTTLKTITGNTGLVNEHTGLAGHGRYLRIYGTARGTQYGYSIFELEAYGSLRAALKTTVWTASLYPNPVAGSQVQVSSNEPLKLVKVIDVSGRIWLSRVPLSNKIDIAALPQGLYFIQVTNMNNETSTLKFIKQ